MEIGQWKIKALCPELPVIIDNTCIFHLLSRRNPQKSFPFLVEKTNCGMSCFIV